MRFISFFIAFFLIAFIGKSQKEFIVPLVTNGLIETSGINSRASGENFYFIVDTLELPFVDDFSKNYQLRYQGYYQGHPQVIDSAQSVYRIGGEVKDEIKDKKTPNYSYYYSSVSGNVDTVLNDSVWIQIFNKEIGRAHV